MSKKSKKKEAEPPKAEAPKKEKKSTWERYHIERGELYFQQKAGSTAWVLFGFALLTGLYAYLGGGGGRGRSMYFVVSAIFLGLGIWQFFYVKKANVTGSEADRSAQRLAASVDPETEALNASDMEYDEFMAAKKISLKGYTALPIGQSEASLRADAADDIARSSHVQVSCFVFGEDTLEAFTTVRSLLDPDQKESTIKEWTYGQIRQISLERQTVKCPITPGGEKTETRRFPVVMIHAGGKHDNRTYAFDEESRPKAEELIRLLQEKQEEIRERKESNANVEEH